MNYSLPLLLTLLALWPQAGISEIYKCRLPDGRIEISNSACQSSTTLTVRRDEPVSPENRAQAERDVARMRDYVQDRETAERNARPSPPAATTAATASSSAPPGPPAALVEECLRDLERQAMEAGRRNAMEAACRRNGKTEGVADGQPIYIGNSIGNSIGQCIRNVERQLLPPAERNRRINQCQGIYTPPPASTAQKPAEPPPAGKTVIPHGSGQVICPTGQKNCSR